MLKFVVWNPEHVNMFANSKIRREDFATEYQYLLAVEKTGSLSSVLDVNDEDQLHQFLNAVTNETNATFNYRQIIKTNT